jgi:hypothetical protein
MIRLLISVAFALAIGTTAEAMSPAPLHEPDAMITQVRKARQCEDPTQVRINGICEYPSFPFWRRTPGQCDDPNQVRINGICQFWAEHEPPARHVCVEWNEGFCVEYYGTLAPCGPEVRC